MSRRAILVISMALFLASPFAFAAPRSEPPAVPETEGGPAPAKPAPASAPAQAKKQAPPKSAAVAEKPAPSPVVFEGKTLFYIKETVLSATPKQRAGEASVRLAKLVKNRAFRADSIQVEEDEIACSLIAEDMALLRVFDLDAAAEGMTRQALAALYVETIRSAIEEHNKAYNFRSLLFGAISAVVATGVLFLILLLYRHLFPRLYARISDWSGNWIRSVHFGSLELLHADQIVRLLLSLVRWFRILTTAALATRGCSTC